MATLTAQQRQELWRDVMSDFSIDWEQIAVNKNELKAAVDAIDQWVNNNAASLNNAIPQPARGALTARQKAALLTGVVRKRFEGGVT